MKRTIQGRAANAAVALFCLFAAVSCSNDFLSDICDTSEPVTRADNSGRIWVTATHNEVVPCDNTPIALQTYYMEGDTKILIDDAEVTYWVQDGDMPEHFLITFENGQHYLQGVTDTFHWPLSYKNAFVYAEWNGMTARTRMFHYPPAGQPWYYTATGTYTGQLRAYLLNYPSPGLYVNFKDGSINNVHIIGSNMYVSEFTTSNRASQLQLMGIYMGLGSSNPNPETDFYVFDREKGVCHYLADLVP